PATATGAAMNRLDGSDVEVMRPLVARLPKTTSACSLERASCWHSSAVLIAPARTRRRYTCSSVGVSPTASNIPDRLRPATRSLCHTEAAKNRPQTPTPPTHRQNLGLPAGASPGALALSCNCHKCARGKAAP